VLIFLSSSRFRPNRSCYGFRPLSGRRFCVCGWKLRPQRGTRKLPVTGSPNLWPSRLSSSRPPHLRFSYFSRACIDLFF